MADIIKRTRKEWLIYHYNIWLKTLTGAETNLMVIEAQRIQVKDVSAYSQATAEVRGRIDEAKMYVKVLEELIKKEK